LNEIITSAAGERQRSAAMALSTKGPDMQRFAILLFVFAAGCSEQPATPTPTNQQEQQGDAVVKTDGHSADGPQLSETTIGDIVLKPKTVIDGKLLLLVPEEFSEMDEETLKFKYPSERRPTLVYTNESGSINVAVNHTKDRMLQSEIGAFHKQMDGMFRNLYPSATWFNSGVIDINGRHWLTLNLRTPAIDTEIRNIMVGTSVDERLLLVSFNVTKELENQWLGPAETIIQSLRVRD
jgi:hypothetical protein